MGSTRPTDRSIGEATFLPQWMKGKSDTRFDYSDGAFSPPADDTFFLIRYPKPAPSANREGFRSISDFLAGKRDNAAAAETGNEVAVATAAVNAEQQIPKQNYTASFDALGASNSASSSSSSSSGGGGGNTEPKLIFANKPRPKPLDDEFRTAGCYYDNKPVESSGLSIVTVASQIMFGKSTANLANSSSNGAAASSSSAMAAADQQNRDPAVQRKGSKSLPATPIASPSGTPDSSPRSRRRAYGNRFFTGAFVPTDGTDRQKNGWLLGSILGQSRELVTPKIDEEDELQQQPEQIPARALSRKKSISSQNLTYFGKEDKQTTTSSTTTSSAGQTTHVLEAQPSELREMNFWSPTSM